MEQLKVERVKNFEIKIPQRGEGVACVTLFGELDQSTCREFEDQLILLEEDRPQLLILDLRGLTLS